MYWTSGQLNNRMYRTHTAVFGGENLNVLTCGVTQQILTPPPLPPKCRLDYVQSIPVLWVKICCAGRPSAEFKKTMTTKQKAIQEDLTVS